MTVTNSTRAEDIAERLARLRPDWKNAERFYELRSELVADLRQLSALLLQPSTTKA